MRVSSNIEKDYLESVLGVSPQVGRKSDLKIDSQRPNTCVVVMVDKSKIDAVQNELLNKVMEVLRSQYPGIEFILPEFQVNRVHNALNDEADNDLVNNIKDLNVNGVVDFNSNPGENRSTITPKFEVHSCPRMVSTYSLSDMVRDPHTKRIVWTELKAFLEKVLKSAN